MSLFRRLFSFSNKEIEATFVLARPVFSGAGIKMLRAPREGFPIKPEDLQNELIPGKLLIVIPRGSGNACHRNRFRRRVKALFFQEKWYQHSGIWVLIVYKRAIDYDFDTIKLLLQKALPLTPASPGTLEQKTQEPTPLILPCHGVAAHPEPVEGEGEDGSLSKDKAA